MCNQEENLMRMYLGPCENPSPSLSLSSLSLSVYQDVTGYYPQACGQDSCWPHSSCSFLSAGGKNASHTDQVCTLCNMRRCVSSLLLSHLKKKKKKSLSERAMKQCKRWPMHCSLRKLSATTVRHRLLWSRTVEGRCSSLSNIPTHCFLYREFIKKVSVCTWLSATEFKLSLNKRNLRWVFFFAENQNIYESVQHRQDK